MSTLEGLRLALRRLTISPALDKTLSDGTDVAGIPKYLRANMVRRGYRPPFNFHHCKGLVLISGVRSCVYRTTSSIGLRSVLVLMTTEAHIYYFELTVRTNLTEPAPNHHWHSIISTGIEMRQGTRVLERVPGSGY